MFSLSGWLRRRLHYRQFLRRSPSTIYDDNACFVMPSGKVFGYLNTYVYDSYGSPDRRLTDNGYFCNQYGYITYDDYGVQYSYGKDRRTRVMTMGAGLMP